LHYIPIKATAVGRVHLDVVVARYSGEFDVDLLGGGLDLPGVGLDTGPAGAGAEEGPEKCKDQRALSGSGGAVEEEVRTVSFRDDATEAVREVPASERRRGGRVSAPRFA